MGKTCQTKPPVVPKLKFVPLPDSIMALYKHVTISIDIFVLNGVKFFHSISDSIKLQTVKALPNESEETLVSCIKKVINLYQSRGFQVIEARGDGQFKCIEEHICPTHLYICTPGEHILQLERSIQTLEGDCRTLYHGLSYKYYPKIIIQSLVQFAVKLQNVFPPLDGINSTMSPTLIVTSLPKPNAARFSLKFGEYVHVHDNPTVTNDINPPRSTLAITLLPANRNGGWYYMSLATGLRILRYKWNSLPVTTDVVHRIHQLACPSSSSKKKRRAYNNLTFRMGCWFISPAPFYLRSPALVRSV